MAKEKMTDVKDTTATQHKRQSEKRQTQLQSPLEQQQPI